jgi:hypothetical protein
MPIDAMEHLADQEENARLRRASVRLRAESDQQRTLHHELVTELVDAIRQARATIADAQALVERAELSKRNREIRISV